MVDFLAALGLAMVIEGIVYALAPEGMKKILLQVVEQPSSVLRYGGLFLAAAGLLVVWMARG